MKGFGRTSLSFQVCSTVNKLGFKRISKKIQAPPEDNWSKMPFGLEEGLSYDFLSTLYLCLEAFINKPGDSYYTDMKLLVPGIHQRKNPLHVQLIIQCPHVISIINVFKPHVPRTLECSAQRKTLHNSDCNCDLKYSRTNIALLDLAASSAMYVKICTSALEFAYDQTCPNQRACWKTPPSLHPNSTLDDQVAWLKIVMP